MIPISQISCNKAKKYNNSFILDLKSKYIKTLIHYGHWKNHIKRNKVYIPYRNI